MQQKPIKDATEQELKARAFDIRNNMDILEREYKAIYDELTDRIIQSQNKSVESDKK